MDKHLIFVSSISDANYAIRTFNRLNHDQVKIICNHPQSFSLFKQCGIPVVDSQLYFPRQKKSQKNYQTNVRLSKLLKTIPEIKRTLEYHKYYFGDILDFSLNLYLAEVQHSFITAKEIIEKEKPDVIHASPRFTESPMKKYQSGNLNCENRSLFELANSLGLISNHSYLVIFLEYLHGGFFIFFQLIRSFIYTLKQLLAPPFNLATHQLIILANHYQLINLLPFLNTLKFHHRQFTILGKASKQQIKLLNKHQIKFNHLGPILPLYSDASDCRIVHSIKYLYLWFKHKSLLKQYFTNPGEWAIVKWKLFYLYLEQIPQLIEFLSLADHIFKQHPRLMLTMATNDIFSKCFALSAKSYHTTIIEVQHGFIIGDEDASFRQNDIYAIWGPAVQSILNREKYTQNLHIVGFPYPSLSKGQSDLNYLALQGRQQLSINPKEKVILVLASFPIGVTRFFSLSSAYGFIDLLIKAVASTNDRWTIIVRPHPSNDPLWINELSVPDSITLKTDFRQIPIEQAVALSDFVIANHTTTLIEALLQNKPLFFYSFSDPSLNRIKKHSLIASGAAQLFQTSGELTRLLLTTPIKTSVKQQQNISKFLSDYCSLPSKISASEKLADLCQQFIL